MTAPPTADGLLEDLTTAQLAAVVNEGSPLCILAAAGAGKTRVLTRRIAYRAATSQNDPRHVLALTFTRKAAGELQHRLRSLGLREATAAGTFHSLATAQLQRWWADRRQHAPTLLDRKSRLLGPLAASRGGLASVPLADLAGHIEWAKASLVDPGGFAEAVSRVGRRLPQGVTAEAVAALYERYEHEKRRRNLVDFDDLLSVCADAIEGDPEFAAAQRWRWRHVYVDEFQDLNPLQHRLLLAWLGPSSDLCVVGDPNQAIYAWNGSDPSLLAGFPVRWPTATVVRLDANHRCSDQIVAAAARVLGAGGSHLSGTGRQGPPPEIRMCNSEGAEARAIAASVVRTRSEGRPWGSMAVLTRTNAQILPIQETLLAAGVPVHAPSRSLVLDEPTARRAIASFRRRSHLPIHAVVADLNEMAAGPGAMDRSVNPAVEPSGTDDEARSALSVLADLALAYSAEEPGGTAGQWLAWLPSATRDHSDSVSPADAVTLCSFHRAKGLEWDAVWLAGLEQGLVPIGRATSIEANEEERRLLYVALTRAGSDLHCSWARQRTFGGRSVTREPSPWLERIAPVVTDEAAEAAGSRRITEGPGRWRETWAEQRRSLQDSSRSQRGVQSRLPEGYPRPDPEVTRRIKAWRLETARSSGVPAYVILHDVTVDAIASIRPSTSEELLAVPGLGPVKAGRYGISLLALVGGPVTSA